MTKDPHWIEHAHLNRGGLHRATHTPPGQKIPSKRLSAAMHSMNPHVKKMAQTAETLKGLRK